MHITVSSILFFWNNDSIYHIKPAENAMNYRKENGFISCPGNHNCDDRSKPNTRAIINRLPITGAGIRMHNAGRKTKYY
jgi:hypothetical protein